ncbi:hypothetical protein [Coraliomargarita parva]|uniref:hypothetical protein n=1 Tax=Coraliomargarita parva TaxID=3014050 RepID=UPI0022B3E362|nr:hypothetical protein [Coraliomargarita parva]
MRGLKNFTLCLSIAALAGCASTEVPMPQYSMADAAIQTQAQTHKLVLLPSNHRSRSVENFLPLYPRLDQSLQAYLEANGFEVSYAADLKPLSTGRIADDSGYFGDYDATKHLAEARRSASKPGDWTVRPVLRFDHVQLEFPYTTYTWAGVKRKVRQSDNQHSAGWTTNTTITLEIKIQDALGRLMFSSRGGICLAMESNAKDKGFETEMTLDPITNDEIKESELEEAIRIALHPLIQIPGKQ